jgi:hypothetical protein
LLALNSFRKLEERAFIQIPAHFAEINALFNKLHRSTNLMALLFNNFGSKNKTVNQNFEILIHVDTFRTYTSFPFI